ncbi:MULTISPECIES: UDP-glucose 4-epimerase GalE [Methylosinus]|uniref:UDP-glucose 4-epimerase n=1 Tax=Methylosinus trichosporium (strain ATCC 35070 / NCIMB 11131 / UNIQEM 75 / OB3b) TaxID=595536 RepID=A0A2D2D2U8_METT3|nr:MULTISPECIES: UDP-glucose 4-epimerase GalE [Methylosinus]ATQ69318.1 UDP-glucose 4-epimerase GalE [Methylosinus trichosporium OB3b]OBS52504.1 UDP-glucose 4-epimerase GalE [Methylosinus sp. 3S-1]
MTILVTGGAGYIGSHMTLELRDAGEKLVVLDDLSTGFRSAVPADVPMIVGDFGDDELVRDILVYNQIDSIIHFAAKIVVPESVADPLGYYLNNTAKARSLLANAVQTGVKRFIFSSTAAVYGDPQSNPVTEDAVLAPVSPYGRSKLMVEWMLEDASRAHGLDYVVLRYFNVAGADPLGRSGQSTPNATHLIKVAAQAALGLRPKLQVFGTDYATPDGTCVRDYIQVNDLARAHLDALRHLRSGGASLVCNCGYGHGFSVLEVIEMVKRVSGVDFPVELAGRRPGDPAAIVAANERIRAAFGWTPRYDDLEAIVRQALDWERRLVEQPPV